VNQRAKFRISQLGFDQGVTIKNTHGIYTDHTLNSCLALLRFVWSLLGPNECKTRI